MGVAGVTERTIICVGGTGMNYELDEADGKRPYESPQLKVISLRPAEAVLGHCKVLGQGGGNISTICGFVCSNAGS